jgi:hypothetical protein
VALRPESVDVEGLGACAAWARCLQCPLAGRKVNGSRPLICLQNSVPWADQRLESGDARTEALLRKRRWQLEVERRAELVVALEPQVDMHSVARKGCLQSPASKLVGRIDCYSR